MLGIFLTYYGADFILSMLRTIFHRPKLRVSVIGSESCQYRFIMCGFFRSYILLWLLLLQHACMPFHAVSELSHSEPLDFPTIHRADKADSIPWCPQLMHRSLSSTLCLASSLRILRWNTSVSAVTFAGEKPRIGIIPKRMLRNIEHLRHLFYRIMHNIHPKIFFWKKLLTSSNTNLL